MFLFGKRLAVLNEIAETKKEFKSNFQKMKSLITDSRMPFEIKSGLKFVGHSAHCWIFVSNNRDCIVMPKGTRRYCCIEINQEKEQDSEYFGTLNKQIMNQPVADAFYSWLMEKHVTVADIAGKGKIPETALQRDMIDISRPTHEKFLQWVRERYEYEQTDAFEEADESSELSSYCSSTDYDGITMPIYGMKLYQMYCAWCERNGERHVVSNTAFGKKINNSGEQLIAKYIGRGKRSIYDLAGVSI